MPSPLAQAVQPPQAPPAAGQAQQQPAQPQAAPQPIPPAVDGVQPAPQPADAEGAQLEQQQEPLPAPAPPPAPVVPLQYPPVDPTRQVLLQQLAAAGGLVSSAVTFQPVPSAGVGIRTTVPIVKDSVLISVPLGCCLHVPEVVRAPPSQAAGSLAHGTQPSALCASCAMRWPCGSCIELDCWLPCWADGDVWHACPASCLLRLCHWPALTSQRMHLGLLTQAAPGTSMAVSAILQGQLGGLLSTIALVLLELGKVRHA